jgi:hypothetical protein
MTVQPFEINIEPAVLDDLRDRLRGTRWPDEIDGAGWDYGMNGSVLRSFVHRHRPRLEPRASLCAPPSKLRGWTARTIARSALGRAFRSGLLRLPFVGLFDIPLEYGQHPRLHNPDNREKGVDASQPSRAKGLIATDDETCAPPRQLV